MKSSRQIAQVVWEWLIVSLCWYSSSSSCWGTVAVVVFAGSGFSRRIVAEPESKPELCSLLSLLLLLSSSKEDRVASFSFVAIVFTAFGG